MQEYSFHFEFAELSWSDSGLPFSVRHQDVYYSQQDAVAESRHVYLQGNRLADRWTSPSDSQGTFVIAEIGFGAGLNFLLSWQLWDQCARNKSWQKLHYIAFERHPITAADLSRIHLLWPDLALQSSQLLANYHLDCAGWHRLILGDDLVLDLVIGDALNELQRRHHLDHPVDAWFLDGFAPDRNPELWSEKLWQLMASHSHQHSTLATYSSAGIVRRGLQDAGFAIVKSDGFGKKRHMLRAEACHKKAHAGASPGNPWFRLPGQSNRHKQAIVIGAGLAGCHTAQALARRGWQVRVLEKAANMDCGVASIPQLALRCRLFKQNSEEARFFLQAFQYATTHYSKLQKSQDCGWHESGVFQLSNAMNKRVPFNSDQIANLYPQSIVHVNQQLPEALRVNETGYFFARGGWIDPQKLCRSLLSSEHISVHLGEAVTGLRRYEGSWQVFCENQHCHTAEVVIISAGADSISLNQLASLPLEISRGQCTLIETPEPFNEIDLVVSGPRTLFPAKDGIQTIAATYRNFDESSRGDNTSAEEDTENLKGLGEMFAPLQQGYSVRNSVAALRASTRDRIPLAGPVPDLEAMANQYADLSRNARQKFKEPGEYHPNLYISAGHGSNGLATTPLCGEFLASLINGECLPVDREAIEALNPCRFLIRDLMKQRLA